jgi:diacylglycerol kinase family enzyme
MAVAINKNKEAADPRNSDHVFIINPKSFQKKADMDSILTGIAAILREYDGLKYRIHVSRYPRDAIGAVNRYVRDMPVRRPVRIYAVGGDGILFDCLNAVMGLDNTELAIVPYGHENEFVRAFGEGVEEGFRDIKAQLVSESIPADVIYCDGNYALNYCVIGLESIAIMRRSNYVRRFSRLMNLSKTLYKCMNSLSNYMSALNSKRSQMYNVLAGDEQLDGSYTAIHIANGPCYGRHMTPTGNSAPDDGLLELVVGRTRSLLATVKFLKVLEFGKYLKRRYSGSIMIFKKQIRELEVSSEKPLIINMDGEVFYETAINVRIVPGGLRIVAPNGARFLRRHCSVSDAVPAEIYAKTENVSV